MSGDFSLNSLRWFLFSVWWFPLSTPDLYLFIAWSGYCLMTLVKYENRQKTNILETKYILEWWRGKRECKIHSTHYYGSYYGSLGRYHMFLVENNDSSFSMVANMATSFSTGENYASHFSPIENKVSLFNPLINNVTTYSPIENGVTIFSPIENCMTIFSLGENIVSHFSPIKNDITYFSPIENNVTFFSMDEHIPHHIQWVWHFTQSFRSCSRRNLQIVTWHTRPFSAIYEYFHPLKLMSRNFQWVKYRHINFIRWKCWNIIFNWWKLRLAHFSQWKWRV